MLPTKKIYIDSRHRTANSVSGSNFKYELPNSLQFPDNCVFFVTDICIPHVFRLIEADVNDRLYYTYSCTIGTNTGVRYVFLQLYYYTWWKLYWVYFSFSNSDLNE